MHYFPSDKHWVEATFLAHCWHIACPSTVQSPLSVALLSLGAMSTSRDTLATERTPQTSGSSSLVGQCCDVMMMSPGQRSTTSGSEITFKPFGLFLLTDLWNVCRNAPTNSMLFNPIAHELNSSCLLPTSQVL